MNRPASATAGCGAMNLGGSGSIYRYELGRVMGIVCKLERSRDGLVVNRILAAILAGSIAAGIAAGPARGQEADLDRAATNIAQAAHDAKLKKVAVFDFIGPGNNVTELGTKLAEEFTQALSRAGQRIDVEDRATLAGQMKQWDYGPDDSLQPRSLLALAAYEHMDAAVFGNINRQGGTFNVSIRVTPTTKNNLTAPMPDVVARENVAIASSDETEKLAETFIARGANPRDIDKTYPAAGRNGYSFPKCLYCPGAQYSEPARKAKFQGTVALSAIVTADGRTDDIKVVSRLPGGLTDKAIEAVQQWKFQPAVDSAGNPVAVKQIIEVTFHLY